MILAVALKIIVIAAVFSVLILAHEFGHYVAAKRMRVKVEKFSLGFGPEIVGFERGQTRYSISAIPFGGYIKMAGEDPQEELRGEPWEYLSQPIRRRLFIVLAGPFSNYIVSFLLFSSIFVIGYPALTSRIGGLIEDFPAKAYGLREGDRIVAIDGKKVELWEEMAEIIHQKGAEELDLSVERDSQAFRVTISPKVDEVTNVWGRKVKMGFLGVTPSDEVLKLRHNSVEAFYRAGHRVLILTVITYRGIWWMVTGKIPFRESVAGPIGIASIIGKAAELGAVYIFQLMAILGVALAIFNLLPLPVLDGGHVLFLAFEKLRGRPLRPKVQETIQQIALIFFIALILFVSYGDILRMVAK